eukprot:CAMPEP_0173304670 /NCGR_PEP_ID=MMETSP1143-20121109/19571_1 /TAXON_ID=483371 /ORGANISM="non described non described, Strain CCMP2298" /LENGTH=127 /DNA_ID=CAMNT_0014245511 /DNA_START=120 /DNA_END=502 /DNA_ORIENTATION=-
MPALIPAASRIAKLASPAAERLRASGAPTQREPPIVRALLGIHALREGPTCPAEVTGAGQVRQVPVVVAPVDALGCTHAAAGPAEGVVALALLEELLHVSTEFGVEHFEVVSLFFFHEGAPSQRSPV